MSDALQDAVNALCEEVGLTASTPKVGGRYELELDGTTLRAFPLANGSVVLSALIGKVRAMAEARRESVQELLGACMTLHGARFRKQGLRESMTIETESDELILWRKFAAHGPSIPEFLQSTELILNEVRFWKRWLLSV